MFTYNTKEIDRVGLYDIDTDLILTIKREENKSKTSMAKCST
jgi:hypothetical protein